MKILQQTKQMQIRQLLATREKLYRERRRLLQEIDEIIAEQNESPAQRALREGYENLNR